MMQSNASATWIALPDAIQNGQSIRGVFVLARGSSHGNDNLDVLVSSVNSLSFSMLTGSQTPEVVSHAESC
jgi:hypothetical protein